MFKKLWTMAIMAMCVFSWSLLSSHAVEVPTMEEKSGHIMRSDLEPGWLASIYAFSNRENIGVFPPAAMGSFKMQKSGAMVNDYVQSLGFPINDKSIGWKGEAYIVAEQKGYYVFMLNTKGRNNFGRIKINGKRIAQGYERAGTIVGNVELEAGIHTVEFQYVQSAYNNGTAGGNTRKDSGFELRIKSPADNAPVPAEKVLLIKK